MSRFVMVSFLFMGWTFYELSGGAGFSAPIRPEPIAIATAKPEVIRDQHVTAASLVTKPVIQARQPAALRRRNTAITATQSAQPARPAADPKQRSRVALAQIAALGETSFGFGLTGTGTGTGTGIPTGGSAVQLASLSGGLAPLASSQVLSDVQVNPSQPLDPAPTPAPDLRQVTASRVNMRSGPGTLYPVVTKLNRDTAVEVLKDSGTGWLHLRRVEDDQTGWIAASLISKKRP
ncbi:MAG: SH3 domain-containing protein [Rhodobacteraceae bacterium]|nr:SH3 domain-containing protein [Paracoccaceae bacterium]